jgi:hypothetical protein
MGEIGVTIRLVGAIGTVLAGIAYGASAAIMEVRTIIMRDS